VQGFDAVGANGHEFDEIHLRDGETLPAGTHDQHGDDRQRERQFHPQGHPPAGSAVEVHRTADALDVRPDDVHTDAPTREIRHGVSGGEAGQEDQLADLPLAHAFGLRGRNEALPNRLLTDLLDGDARAVVGDLDDHLPGLVKGAQGEQALFGFAGGASVRRRLDAVIDTVADHVRQGIPDGLDEGAVEFRLTALELEPDLFAAGEREVPHHPRQLVEDRPDGLHPGLHDPFLQLGRQVRQALTHLLQAAIGLYGGVL
jgi:hypothetical protein